jgi:hypothetical protein
LSDCRFGQPCIGTVIFRDITWSQCAEFVDATVFYDDGWHKGALTRSVLDITRTPEDFFRIRMLEFIDSSGWSDPTSYGLHVACKPAEAR